ncbi:hypothetical protein JCM3770_001739 [Rhodotorula araucariae]
MHYSAVTLALSLLALSSTASATCHRVSRRALAVRDAVDPINAASPAAQVRRSSSHDGNKVVRRQKGGARLDRQNGGRAYADWSQGGTGNSASSALKASMTAPAGASGTPTTSMWTKGASSSQTGTAGTISSTTSSASHATSSNSSSNASASTYSGKATFFYQNGVAGACGTVHSDSDKVVALQSSMYGSGMYCGRSVEIKNTANGQSVLATVADECPTCESSHSLDLSTGAFDDIGSEETGELSVTWSFSD